MLSLAATVALLLPGRAGANCFPNSPGSFDTVTCNTDFPNPETTPITAQPLAFNVTVRLFPGAQLSVDGTAITLTHGGEIVNNGGGSVSGRTGINTTGAVTITNSGQITGTSGPAIHFNGGHSEIDNLGTIGGNGTSVITLDTNRGDTVELDNASGGSINGNVTGSGDGDIRIDQKGNFNGGVTISGDGETTIISAAGHNFNAPVSISGQLNIIDNGGAYNAGLTLDATLTNTVTNEQNAVINQVLSATGGSNFITNAGTLNNGLSVAGNGFNTISNRAGASINQSFSVNGSGIDTIFNSGTINATMNVSGTGVVVNGGTISGGATAIAFTAGTTATTGTTSPFTLELVPGFVINGAVFGTGRDELELGGSGSASFDVSAIGASQQYRGFLAFQKVDPSTWTLTGSGAQNWDVRGGTLVGDTNSLQGTSLTDSAELVFNQNFAGTYAGEIAGNGDVMVSGGGALTFTGANTYSGSTTIAGSTLSLGSGGTTGSVSGDIVDRGTLIFNRSDTLVLFDNISSSGALQQSGAGRTVLVGFSSFFGATSVNAGTLEVDGAIAHSSVMVMSGATLAGNGAVGPTTIAAGGTFAPGDAPGTMAVQGDLVFQSGANYSVAVAPRIASSIFVTGNTSVAGTLTAVATGGPFTRNAIYPVLISVGPLTGTFNLATSGDFSGTSLSLLYSTHDVFLNLSTTPVGPPVWSTNPSTSDWNTGSNWQSGSVPLATDIAHFGASSITTIDINQPNTEVAGLAFDAGAPAYTFRITGTGTTPASLIVSGSGVAKLSGNAADFLVGGTAAAPGALLFESSATPDQANITSGAFGTTFFTGPGTAANARLIADSGGAFDFSGIGATHFTIGSIEGAGTFALGSAELTEGGNGLDTLVSGTISDGGAAGGTGASLTKLGNGTLTLSGDNSYTGLTTIAGGTLQLGAGGTSGSVAGNIIDNQSLVIDHSGVFRVAGAISGDGSVAQTGSGITELTANDTYTGSTSIQSGTLVVHGTIDGTSNVAVGNGGTAALLVDHGGTLSDGTGLLGSLAGTTGSAIVSGTGSLWSNSGSLTIGSGGTGSLVIARGASVIASSVVIAQAPGSTGTLAIGGAPSTLPVAAGTLDPPSVTFGAGAGSLVFNHIDPTYVFDASLSGGGTVRQDGPGTTILTADSSAFTGTSAVNAGTLAIRGVFGAPSSTLAVNSGGTLTGTGTVGAVTVNSGGSLSGTQGETLTLASLALGSGSNLDVALGSQATTAFFAVNGALTLGGQLNVGDLGGFGGGIYRLIDYTGPLTDNGLAIGTVPPGTSASDLAIQTSVAGQVNLVNSRGVTVRFWDGKGPPNDGVVQGGSDIWNATTTNWTTADGTINGAWSTEFAIFAAAPGTVFVDTSQGTLAVTGMQFAVDGYRLIGDPLVLAGAEAVIRVGDGSRAASGFTATIDDVLGGGAALIKTDQGTLILEKANTYSGGTFILGGTISISSDTNLGAATGGLTIDQGTLATTADIVSTRSLRTVGAATISAESDTTLELDGAVTGAGSLTKTGDGSLVLAGDDMAAGGTTISAGTLTLGNGGVTGTLAGDMMDNAAFAVNRSGTVTLAGVISGSGSFTQSGPGTAILTNDSDYAGGTTIADGTLQLGNGGASGSIRGAIIDDATLAIDRSDVFELPNAVSGSGALEQLGSGATMITGDDTYSGGTTISAGVLQIGDGSTSGSITGDVTDNSSLVFARSDVLSFSGAISGTGSVEQAGAGRLIFTGTSTYSGGTLISAGTLQLGDGGATGSIVGAVTDNSVLAVNRSDTFDFGAAITGSGSFLQLGSGTTLLSGTSTYTGVTDVQFGQLTVRGTLTGTSQVIVGNFATASLLIGRGGTVSTDNAIIGNLPRSSGNALVGGAASSWTIAGALEVGRQGTGTLTLVDGAHVNAGSVLIAESVGSIGTVNIGAPVGIAPRASGLIDPPTITFGLGTGTLNFNHASPAYTFDAPISGFGTIAQNGPGTTILTADSSGFTGLSVINAGTLDVRGTLGSPSSASSVETGGTLTGTGTVAGTVIVNSGGTLSEIQGQTLTLGSLTLASGSVLDVMVGIPGTTALFHVNGDLTLGGTLDITDLGGFSPGVYRLIDYGGALTDNGLAIGTLPPGVSTSAVSVQTSVANQVNLVNTSGVTLQFWDGQGPPNDGVIQGGDGTWNAVNTSWTNATGAVNGTWNSDFAIFGSAPGTVTVDASQGAIAATGMQFAVDGYRLTGDPIALEGGAPVIRVGDGTTSGAAFTATIDNTLSGSGKLIKTDQGTLVLNGANIYSGGTVIARGAIRISSDTNLGAATGTLDFVDGTLETTANIVSGRAVGIVRSATFVPDAGTTLELDGAIAGPGALILNGAGTLVIAGADTALETAIAAGTLVLGNGGTSGSIAGEVVDNGAFAVNRSDTVVLNGIISGAGSFAQIGAGTTILTAENNYAGGTTIAQGTLQLGNGGASGSIIGPVADNGTLAIDRSDIFTIADVISGSGALIQAGSGTTVLTAGNTYAGGTAISQGALQVGDGNVSGSIVGDVTDNGILAFDRADMVTFAGTISGTGGLAQIGAGTLILAGNDTYNGGTLIASGVLQLGNGGTSGSIQGSVVDNGKFVVDRSDGLTLDSSISGTGAFAQIGTGVTTLAGNSSYSGATGVGLGTLIVQGALTGTSNVRVGDLGSATLLIENGGSVTDTRAGLGLLSGTTGTAVVSGAGSLWASRGPLIIGGAGAGTLTISNGALVTAGSVLIAQSGGSVGMLAIGALPGAAAQAPGTLDPPTITFGAGTGSLVFNQTSVGYVFDAPIAGNGTIEQDGPGTTTLTANSSAFTGTTTVNAGALVVDGTLGSLASAVAVNGGGRLAGTGTIGGSVSVISGGVLSPAGLPVGTLTVGGNLAFAPGASYRVGLTPAAADLTKVGGSAALAGGVQVIAAPGAYPANATYPILAAAGGVTGTFDSQVTISSVFLAPTLSYSSNEVDLVLAAKPFPDIAETPNQGAVAGAVESLGPSNPVFDAVFGLTGAEEARRAFDALSGEVHASTAGVMIQNSRYVRDAILSRLRGSLDTKGPSETVDIPMNDPPNNIWMQGVAAVSGADSDGNAASLDRSIVGIIGGADTALDETWRAGIAAAYTHSILHQDVRASRASSNDLALALYGSGNFDALALRVGAAYTWHAVETRRAVVFTDFADSDTAHYHAQDFQAFGEAGYTFFEGPMALEPFANIAYVKLDSGPLTEKGGAAALTAPDRSLETIFTTVGSHASGVVGDISGAPVHLNLTLGWVHAFGDVVPSATFAFASGGAPFTVLGAPLARDSALVETGFDMDITPTAKFSFLYSGELAAHARDNSFKAALVWNF